MKLSSSLSLFHLDSNLIQGKECTSWGEAERSLLSALDEALVWSESNVAVIRAEIAGLQARYSSGTFGGGPHDGPYAS